MKSASALSLCIWCQKKQKVRSLRDDEMPGNALTFLGLATKSMDNPIQSVRLDQLCVCSACKKQWSKKRMIGTGIFPHDLPDVRNYVISEYTNRAATADTYVGTPNPHALDLAFQLYNSMKDERFDMLNASLAILSHNWTTASASLVPKGEQHSFL